MMRCFVYTALNYNSPDSYGHSSKLISHFVPIQCIFAQRGVEVIAPYKEKPFFPISPIFSFIEKGAMRFRKVFAT